MIPFLSIFLSLFVSLSVARAADYNAANEDVWPSQNDIAQTTGNGKKLLENQWAFVAGVFGHNNYGMTGLTVPSTSASLSINVAAGTAYLSGRWVSIPASTSVTATASFTNYVFLKLARDGANLVTGAVFEVNISGTAPADATPIATLTAGASTITATTDARILGPGPAVVLTSGTTFTYPAGITRIYVEAFAGSGGGGGGGEAYDIAGPAVGTSGGDGTAGGTTTFNALTANGGAAGKGGLGGGVNAAGPASAAHGSASGGYVNLPGLGPPGGNPGMGGQTGTAGGVAPPGLPGGRGGDGGYSAGYFTGAVGSTLSYAIGAAGTAGTAGSGNPGPDGSAGQPGLPGRIVIYY
jgi:hypothetical protein